MTQQKTAPLRNIKRRTIDKVVKYRRLARIAKRTNAPKCAAKWERKADKFKKLWLIEQLDKNSDKVEVKITIGKAEKGKNFATGSVEVLNDKYESISFLQSEKVSILDSKYIGDLTKIGETYLFNEFTCLVSEGTIIEFTTQSNHGTTKAFFKASRKNNLIKAQGYTLNEQGIAIEGYLGWMPYTSITTCVYDPEQYDIYNLTMTKVNS